jgi:hypothetical protein
MVLNKFPEIPDEDLWMFYEPVRRDGGTRLFDYWRSAIPHIVEEQYYRASLFAGRAPEGDKSKAILQYLENQGEDLFAWMHKEEPKPRFGRDPINNSNLDQIGLALVAYHNFDMANRPGPYVPEPIVPSNMPEPTYPAALMPVALNPQIQDQVIESKPWVPAPYWGDALGCTGGLGAEGQQVTQYSKRDLPRVHHPDAIPLHKEYFIQAGFVETKGGTQRDYAAILPMTYVAEVVLGWMRAADSRSRYKEIWEGMPPPRDPLNFWETLNRRILFTSPAIQKEPARLSKSLYSKTEIGKWVSVNESSDEKVYRARAEDFMNRYPGLATQQGPRSYRVNWSTLQEVWKTEDITPIERPNFKTA